MGLVGLVRDGEVVIDSIMSSRNGEYGGVGMSES